MDRSEDLLQTPDPTVAVPLAQALTYTAQNDTLREMFLDLLTNAMDSSMNDDMHPSYVEIIKQMNSLDARVFQKLITLNDNVMAVSPQVAIAGTEKYHQNATPEWFVGWTSAPFSMCQHV